MKSEVESPNLFALFGGGGGYLSSLSSKSYLSFLIISNFLGILED